MVVSTDAELRTVYPPPAPRAAQKVLDHLDVHCRNFIALSPFCVLSSSDASGQADASPRGDPPGFVRVLDDKTLLLPDRPGNNQVDSLQNVVANPGVGLLFFVPGVERNVAGERQGGDRDRPRNAGADDRSGPTAALRAEDRGGRSLSALRTRQGRLAMLLDPFPQCRSADPLRPVWPAASRPRTRASG